MINLIEATEDQLDDLYIGQGTYGAAYAANGLVLKKFFEEEDVALEANYLASLPAGPWPEYISHGDDYILMTEVVGSMPLHVLFTEEQVIACFSKLVVLLKDLHAMGFSHGDVSPYNVKIQEDGSVYLLDFGCHGCSLEEDLDKAATLWAENYGHLDIDWSSLINS